MKRRLPYRITILTQKKSSLPVLYDYDYNFPHTAKEKVLESSSELYNKLLRGLTDTTLTAAGGMSGGVSSYTSLYPSSNLSALPYPEPPPYPFEHGSRNSLGTTNVSEIVTGVHEGDISE